MVQSPAGIIFIFDELRPIQHKATPSVVEVAHLSADWQDSRASPMCRKGRSSVLLY
jgi:hypothetical protein